MVSISFAVRSPEYVPKEYALISPPPYKPPPVDRSPFLLHLISLLAAKEPLSEPRKKSKERISRSSMRNTNDFFSFPPLPLFWTRKLHCFARFKTVDACERRKTRSGRISFLGILFHHEIDNYKALHSLRSLANLSFQYHSIRRASARCPFHSVTTHAICHGSSLRHAKL